MSGGKRVNPHFVLDRFLIRFITRMGQVKTKAKGGGEVRVLSTCPDCLYGRSGHVFKNIPRW